MSWAHPHLLGIETLAPADIQLILDSALEHFRSPTQKRERLRGKTILLAFFEPSTRTRSSFEIAAKRLGADVVNVGTSGTSVVLNARL